VLLEQTSTEYVIIDMDCYQLDITGGNYKSINLLRTIDRERNVTIDELFIDFRGLIGMIWINNVNIIQATFVGIIGKDTELLIQHSSFYNVLFRNLTNVGKIKLFSILAEKTSAQSATLSVVNANMSRAEFVNLDLSHILMPQISNSYLIDYIFVNVIWPKEIVKVGHSNNPKTWLNVKETYRQLKYSYSKQGDSVMEHRFHLMEMESYRRYLKLHRGSVKTNGIYYRWRKDRQTSIILWFSFWSSDYGQSFKAPVLTLLGAGLMLFPIMLFCGFFKDFSAGFHPDLSLKQVSLTIGHFLNFINPLRRYDMMDINVGLLLDYNADYRFSLYLQLHSCY
jgi:hypothetical protein